TISTWRWQPGRHLPRRNVPKTHVGFAARQGQPSSIRRGCDGLKRILLIKQIEKTLVTTEPPKIAPFEAAQVLLPRMRLECPQQHARAGDVAHRPGLFHQSDAGGVKGAPAFHQRLLTGRRLPESQTKSERQGQEQSSKQESHAGMPLRPFGQTVQLGGRPPLDRFVAKPSLQVIGQSFSRTVALAWILFQ